MHRFHALETRAESPIQADRNANGPPAEMIDDQNARVSPSGAVENEHLEISVPPALPVPERSSSCTGFILCLSCLADHHNPQKPFATTFHGDALHCEPTVGSSRDPDCLVSAQTSRQTAYMLGNS